VQLKKARVNDFDGGTTANIKKLKVSFFLDGKEEFITHKVSLLNMAEK